MIPRGSIPDWLIAMRGSMVQEDVPPPPPPPDISEAPIPDWLKEPPPPVEEGAPGLLPEGIGPAGEAMPDWLSTLRSSAIAADDQTTTLSPRPSAWTPAPERERRPLVSARGPTAVQTRAPSRASRLLEVVALLLIIAIALTLFCLTAWLMWLNLQ